MMPDWTVTMEISLKKIQKKKKLYKNSTLVRKLNICKKHDNSERIKDENRSYFLIVG